MCLDETAQPTSDGMIIYVVIDNLSGIVLGFFHDETLARQFMKPFGNEKIHEDFCRYGYEEWSLQELVSYLNHPENMGLGKRQLITKTLCKGARSS